MLPTETSETDIVTVTTTTTTDDKTTATINGHPDSTITTTTTTTTMNHQRTKLQSKITIRCMRENEIDECCRIFADANLHDAPNTIRAYYRSDPDGFVVAIDETIEANNDDDDRQKYCGKVIGCCAAPITTHRTAALGLYVVDRKYQGLGIGVKMFNQCMQRCAQLELNCGLSAVPSKFDIYKNRAGFRLEEGCSMVIMQGVPQGLDRLRNATQYCTTQNGVQLRALTNVEQQEDLVQKIVAFDQRVHLDNRDRLLRCAFSLDGNIVLALVNEHQPNRPVIGYGMIQPDSINRPMLGPVYASEPEIAEVLLYELLHAYRHRYYSVCSGDCADSDEIVLFTTSKATAALHLFTNVLQLTEIDRCEKLYTKFIPPFNYDMLYCCHTPDFSN